MKSSYKSVAIAVPMSNRVELTSDEKVSMRHLTRYLGDYNKYLVIPETLKINHPGFKKKRFENSYFGSAKAHNRLLLSLTFYEAFRDYKYILIYHLDSLVFSDQLQHWCNQDFDYIGAPWIKHPDTPYAGNVRYEGKVGNGGFSLRKIRSFLKVINSKKIFMQPNDYWERFHASKPIFLKLANTPKKILKSLKIRNNAKWEMKQYVLNEESFWANRANYYYPQFNIAPLNVALQFAFECVPRYCYEQNNNNLPFGCHAWNKYDREFWKPFLLRQDN